MSKVNICAFDQECVQKFQHYIKHPCLPIHHKLRNKPCFRILVFFFNNILPTLHLVNMLIIIMFYLCPHESIRICILIPFSRNVALSRIACLFFVIVSASHLCISITLHFPFTIAYTSMVCCICTWTSVDGCISASITFSSLTFALYVFPQSAVHNFIFLWFFNEHWIYWCSS